VERYEQVEQAGGGGGYVLNPGTGDTQGWMENIMHIAACKYYLVSGDQSVLPLLGRMRDFFKNEICVLSTGTMPNITLPMVHVYWTPAGGGALAVHHDWAMSESFAYSAVVFNSQNDLVWSRAFHDAASRWWQAPANGATYNVFDSGTFSPVTFRPQMFPGSESKVLANLLRWGGGELAARALLQP
jgi:hypothetical protein